MGKRQCKASSNTTGQKHCECSCVWDFTKRNLYDSHLNSPIAIHRESLVQQPIDGAKINRCSLFLISSLTERVPLIIRNFVKNYSVTDHTLLFFFL